MQVVNTPRGAIAASHGAVEEGAWPTTAVPPTRVGERTRGGKETEKAMDQRILPKREWNLKKQGRWEVVFTIKG